MRDPTAGPTGQPTDTTGDALLVAIVEELARVRGVDPLDLPPLQDYVDTDALGTLFRPGPGTASRHGWVTFAVEHHEVRVSHDGTVSVVPRDVGHTGQAAYN